MKFSIGDQILLKRTGEEGHIVSFLSASMMEVEVSGVRFPVYNEEVDHPYLKWFTEERKKKPARLKSEEEIPVEKAATRAQRLARGIYLSFLPQYAPGSMDDIIESFKIHFINESPDAIAFSYDARTAAGASIFSHRATLHPFGHVYLHPLSLEDLNDQPRFHWEVAPVDFAAGNSVPVGGLLRIRPAQLIRHIRDMLEANNPAFSLLLTTDAAQPATTVPAASAPVVAIGSIPNKKGDSQVILHTVPETVIDLHIGELRQGGAALSPDEMLQVQLGALHQKLQAALATGMERMIIIHGIGKGTLRQHVHLALGQLPGVRSFSNHWMSGYGPGATEVLFGTTQGEDSQAGGAHSRNG